MNDVHDQFIRLNANRAFITNRFTEVLRDLVRAISIASSPDERIYTAADGMNFVGKLLAHYEEDISWSQLFSAAVENLRKWDADKRYEKPAFDAARTGMSLIAELSCTDNAAEGRISKKLSVLNEATRAMQSRNRN